MLIGICLPWSLSCQVDDRIDEVVEAGDIGEDMMVGVAVGVWGGGCRKSLRGCSGMRTEGSYDTDVIVQPRSGVIEGRFKLVKRKKDTAQMILKSLSQLPI